MRKARKSYKVTKIRPWKQQKAYIISYEQTWHEDVIYAPTLRTYCNQYGIPMKTTIDLKNLLECPNMYFPPNFFGIQ